MAPRTPSLLALLPLLSMTTGCHVVDHVVDRKLDDAVSGPECKHALDCDRDEVCEDGECKTAEELK